MQSPVVCPAPPHLWRFLVIAEKYLNFRHLKILKPTLCTLCCWWHLACPGTATTGGPLRRNSCMAAAKRYLHQKIFQLIHLRLEIFGKLIFLQLSEGSVQDISAKTCEWMCLLCRPLWGCHWASPAPSTASGAAGWSPLAAARKKYLTSGKKMLSAHINPLLNDLLDLCNCLLNFDWLVTLR